MRRSLRCVCCTGSIVFFLFVALGLTTLFKYLSVERIYKLRHQKLEDTKIECSAILEGKSEAAKYQGWRFSYKKLEQKLEKSEEICDLLNKHFLFEKSAQTLEERNYPLAFGLLVHKNAIQVIMALSLLYQPQNQYCMSIDNVADMNFKNILLKIPRCYPNIRVQLGEASGAPINKMGILNNMHDCLVDLTIPAKKWEYYQFVTGEDLPLKTNSEMVKVLKALNGTISTEIHDFSAWRYGIRRAMEPPLKMYQGSAAVALPRAAADVIVQSNKTREFLIYLEKTHIAHESFWATLAANRKKFPLPGSFYGEDLKFVQQFNSIDDEERNEELNISKTSIASYDIIKERNCDYCSFEIEDVPKLLEKPELIGHKFSLENAPAIFICMVKELRRRSRDEDRQFNARSYSLMPTVELGSGKRPEQLSRPQWMRINKLADRYN